MRNMMKGFYVPGHSRYSMNGITKRKLCKEGKRVKKHYLQTKKIITKSKALIGLLLLQVI